MMEEVLVLLKTVNICRSHEWKTVATRHLFFFFCFALFLYFVVCFVFCFLLFVLFLFFFYLVRSDTALPTVNASVGRLEESALAFSCCCHLPFYLLNQAS